MIFQPSFNIPLFFFQCEGELGNTKVFDTISNFEQADKAQSCMICIMQFLTSFLLPNHVNKWHEIVINSYEMVIILINDLHMKNLTDVRTGV